MSEPDSDRVFLTYDEAVAMLPEGDQIHTYLNPALSVMIGADWPRSAVLDLLRTGKPEIAGLEATRIHHGLVAWSGEQPVFVETKP